MWCRIKGMLDRNDQRNGKYIVPSMLCNQSNFYNTLEYWFYKHGSLTSLGIVNLPIASDFEKQPLSFFSSAAMLLLGKIWQCGKGSM